MAYDDSRPVQVDTDTDTHADRGLAPTGAAAAALARLDRATRTFLALDGLDPGSPRALLHATAASMHDFITTIDACEAAGLDRDGLRPRIDALRSLHGRSPFVNRLQTWPRGYQGDFETVERLCDALNEAPFNTVAWAIEQCALQSPIAQQHRNKVALQARAILATALRLPHPRIASLGCGGCRDLGLVVDCLPPGRGTFVLTDADGDALELARTRLAPMGDCCRFVHGRVPRSLSAVARFGPFDLVVAGGLFDYLPDAWAVTTLRATRRMLAPNGRLLLSNIAAGNPFRPWLEYLAEWRLIERSEADLRRLLDEAGFPLDRMRIERDTTQLTLMVDARSAGSDPVAAESPASSRCHSSCSRSSGSGSAAC